MAHVLASVSTSDTVPGLMMSMFSRSDIDHWWVCPWMRRSTRHGDVVMVIREYPDLQLCPELGELIGMGHGERHDVDMPDMAQASLHAGPLAEARAGVDHDVVGIQEDGQSVP